MLLERFSDPHRNSLLVCLDCLNLFRLPPIEAMHGAVLAFSVSVCASVEGFLEVGGSAKQLYA